MVQFAMGFAFGRPTETGRRSMQSQIECQALIRMVSSLFYGSGSLFTFDSSQVRHLLASP